MWTTKSESGIKIMRKKYISGNFSFKTDIGKVRMTNEDQAMGLTNARGNILLVVCDGMGGQNKGDLASKIAIDILKEEFSNIKKIRTKAGAYYWLSKTLRKANTAIFNEASRNPLYSGMGTTITAILLLNNYLLVAQAGDSRAYTLSNNFEQITEDQTYVNYLFKTGQISEEEIQTHPKRHVLMNALGIYPSVDLDIKVKKYNNESLLLCSDGLYNNVNKTDIEAILRNEDSCEQKVHELINIANANGGSDNIAVVIWEANK